MSEYGRFVSTNTFFLGTVSLNDYINTLDVHRSLFQELQLDREEFRGADDIFERFSGTNTFGPFELEHLRKAGSITEKQHKAFKELYITLTIDQAVGIDYRLPSPDYENRYWVLHKDENDIIRVAKAELTDDFQVDITMLDRNIFLSSADSFSSDYWSEPSIGFFPNGNYNPFDEWMTMRKLDMHIRAEDPPSFFKSCFGRKPSLNMCTKLMSDQRVPKDHEIISKCQRIIQTRAFAHQ
ncbi:unnamed protein product [Oikopleura dioica]|uniref:Uncharacterized protein n=1 Tax=Oikopleura dioica TaxID=34765 RepID=E4Z501_OIKDI|nr:unnamed protein product [Oikopleura dioica]